MYVSACVSFMQLCIVFVTLVNYVRVYGMLSCLCR